MISIFKLHILRNNGNNINELLLKKVVIRFFDVYEWEYVYGKRRIKRIGNMCN